ncbi:MAG: DEAD/DEAH box helicase family protein [Spirochaetaceae bacterium]|jgi:hypothetical protein|nr:DEAD/DEAH box helicase family protein [Spirochaetaceae bacterium]
MAKKKESPQIPFNDRLVLFRYFLRLFNRRSLEDFGKSLNNSAYEGFNENQNTRFFSYMDFICKDLNPPGAINRDALRRYDENICRYFRQISAKRGNISLKYFQYLALLFTEMYLDRYFSDREQFMNSLNAYIDSLERSLFKGFDIVTHYTPDAMNKLSFMCATGSGKTLIMHINVLQFLHYYQKARRNNHSLQINKIMLLCPNEGLSLQHKAEFDLSSIPASLFNKNTSLDFYKEDIVIIDMNKLKEEGRVKTVSIDFFEKNNLVLVDEAHRGLRGDVWYDNRSRLFSDNGFSFEYSATLKQALKNDESLLDEYGKSIIMDYSYKYFYNDGYGKEYRIYNLTAGIDRDEKRQIYLTGCLLSFYQQIKLYTINKFAYTLFNIERPLLVFVGNRVSAPVKSNGLTLSEKELLTDIEEVLKFLDVFVNKRKKTISNIEKVLSGKTGIIDRDGNDMFAQNFNDIAADKSGEEIYYDILNIVFNCPGISEAPRLHIVDIKQTRGEIGLRIGEYGGYFGVINIGDTRILLKKCGAKNMLVQADEFNTVSLFRQINNADSTVNVLIGSRKFTEGWNSWRVSTMGLINFAQGEGPQAIQLFGRGVRLRGYGHTLKRSDRLDNYLGGKPPALHHLETLTIFGIKADYMAEFRLFLEREELPPNDGLKIFHIPVISRFDNIKDNKLQVIRVSDNVNFVKSVRRELDVPDDKFKRYIVKNKITLDCRAKVQGIDSTFHLANIAQSYENTIERDNLIFIDFTQIYFTLLKYKAEKKYYNITIDTNKLRDIITFPGWYTIVIPRDELRIDNIEKAVKLTGYACILLQRYLDKFFCFKKDEYEGPYLEYQDIAAGDPNFVNDYVLTGYAAADGGSDPEVLRQFIDDLTKILNKAKSLNAKHHERYGGALDVFDFPNHLYAPLIYVKEGLKIQVSPVSLVDSEYKFVNLLQRYLENNALRFNGKSIFLLRNKSSTGMGFFEAGNFYPDFILWIDTPKVQYMSFIDPKGLLHLSFTDPKIEFYQRIKELEERLQKPPASKQLILNSFIMSDTSPEQLDYLWGNTAADRADKHIFCLGNNKCIESMFKRILPE